MRIDELISALEHSRQEFLDAIEGLSDEAMQEPGVVGDWSVKDIMVHLSMWEAELIKLLWQAQQRDTPTTAHFGKVSVDDTNARWYKLTSGRILERVVEDFEGTRIQHFRRLDSFDDKDLNDVKRFPWLKGTPLVGWIAGDSYEHEAEHAAQIREWRTQKGI